MLDPISYDDIHATASKLIDGMASPARHDVKRVMDVLGFDTARCKAIIDDAIEMVLSESFYELVELLDNASKEARYRYVPRVFLSF